MTTATLRPATDDDAPRWDKFVSDHLQGSAYHRWAWKLAMEQSYGLKTHYYLAEDAQSCVTGILPAARVPHPLGRGKLCSLPYCDLGEPLAAAHSTLEQLLKILRSENTGTHEIRGSALPTPKDTGGDGATAQLQPGQKVRLLLDLPETSDALLAGFKSKHRSQINKAAKNGLTATIGNDAERVEKFYTVFARNMRDLGSPTHSLRWFKAIARHYGDDCLIGLVDLEGENIASGIVLITGDKAVIPWASTLREYNRLAPNMQLYWTLLEAVTNRGCAQFDFGRSSFGEGTYRFKTQWGAKPLALDWRLNTDCQAAPHRDDTATSAGTVNASTIRPAIEYVWRNLPLPLTVAVGARLRPYVSL